MGRKDYTTTDFVNDEEFAGWVLQPNYQSELFWSKYIAANPDQTAQIEEARGLLLLMHFKDSHLDDHSIIKIKSEIDLAIASSNHDPEEEKLTNIQVFYKTTLFRIAASFLIVACLFTGFWMLGRNGDSIHFADGLPVFNNTNTVKTTKGERSAITLEDGTQVWLNADSRITYSKNFLGGENREVFLEGEAFFDVVKNEGKPFIVNTSSLSVAVLGTAFNVKAFQDDPAVETTLIHGKVVIHTNDNKTQDITLMPNQQAVYIKYSKQVILENQVEAEHYASWKSGQLYFKDETFKTIAEELERWYNVKIHIQGKRFEVCRFSAKIQNKTLPEVLDLFAVSQNSFEYKINGKEVFIVGDFCSE